jgi:hypothetical protein
MMARRAPTHGVVRVLAHARRRRDDSRVDVVRIAIAGAIIVAVVAGISFGLATRDPSLAPDVDWSMPAPLPSPTRADLRSEFVSDEQGFRFYPRTDRVEQDVAYAFDTGHCGLGHLTDFDGSFWEPVDRERADSFDLLANQDVGAMALVGRERAIYRSSDGIEIRMERIDGPVVTQPCE